MKIRDKLYLSSIISICLFGIFVLVVVLTSNKITEESKEYKLVYEAHLAVSQLNIIAHEYLIYHEKRMEQQWHLRYDSTAKILAAEEETERGLMESIHAEYTVLGDLFSQVTANYGKMQKLIQEGSAQEKIDTAIRLEERLGAQLLIKSQSIIIDASRLAEKSMAELIKAQELAKNLTLSLVLILVAFIVIIVLTVSRIISKSLGKLTKGVEIIGKGNFEHKIDLKSKDEMGQLATAFNEMTGKLKESYTDLEKEIAERKQAEERLVRSEKLAVLGQLAGDVAHELRNPLGAIKNAAYFLNLTLKKPEPEVKETLEILDKEVGTSERIISSLLDFARPKLPIRQKVDINELIQGTLSRITMPKNVKVVSQLNETLPAILADPDQLGQVFGNIILNGIQAMPEGGRLSVKSEVESPEWLTISFTDTGMGIPEENLNKLFEPLFTTKAKGIGLGLAITKTLIERHGGVIQVQSKVGKGSTFTVRLPMRY